MIEIKQPANNGSSAKRFANILNSGQSLRSISKTKSRINRQAIKVIMLCQMIAELEPGAVSICDNAEANLSSGARINDQGPSLLDGEKKLVTTPDKVVKGVP